MDIILFLAEIEFIFSIVAWTVLCFESVMRMML